MKVKSILIIEDEAPLLKLLKNTLEEKGYSIQTATNGNDGLNLALKWLPDLILLDIILPGKDGLTLLRELREHQSGARIPVILLSNLADTDKVLEAQKFHIEDYLIKSDWKLEDVVAKIKEKLA